jgi:putative copper resistance protein D
MSSGQIPTLLWRAWQPAWGPDVAAALAMALYLSAARRVTRGWPWARTLSFAAGLATVLVAIQSGIGGYDDALLSDHMVQHLLLIELAPLLLLGGRPLTLMLRSAAPDRRPRLARGIRRLRTVSHPLSCLAITWVAVGATHLPAVYDLTLRDPLLHEAEHALYVGAGLLMWWPILDEDPLPSHQLDGLLRLVYVTAAMVPMTILGAYLTRDPTLLYAPYAAPARALGVSAVVDQQQAGAIMWVLGSSLMVICGLWQAMAALVAEERRMQARERRADDAALRERRPGGA